MRPFRRLLIANRGEIAVRIARAAHESGIAALGVFSDADRGAFFLETMDDAVRIGPGEAAASYLDAGRILAAARELGADAVHPGYGFLSERAPFARACAEAGLVFVGPPPEAIDAMGDKAEAKRRAREHGVPVVPGYDGDDVSPDRLRREARAIGLPLLVKATAGGGGRGMRVVRDLAEFDDAVASARREALAAFGDDRVLLERYVDRPRHVEIQILADTHGTVLDVGERECSIQRRHQKIVEEAPSPAVGPELRARLVDAAVRTARSVGYVNAGTVEFLLAQDGNFYFLEMNARLQVEHPVTELVHGVDLVRLQFEIARGERLAPDLDRRVRGWAIEARIVAEDEAERPAAGRITRWAPAEGPGLRLDAGVASGSEISIYYDSLLAKLIAFAPTRDEAVVRLRGALERFEVGGLPTNLPQLRAITRDAAFAAGETTTAFLTERAAALARDPAASDDVFLLVAAALADDSRAWRIAGGGLPLALETSARRVRAGLSVLEDAPRRLRLTGDLRATVVSERAGDRRLLHVATGDETGETPRRVAGEVVEQPDGTYLVRLGEATVRVRLAPPPARSAANAHAEASAGLVTAPMPGKIVRTAVVAGQRVAERELLVVLEAMKMEHRIVAPAAGIVAAVHVAEGAVVAAGAPVVEIA